MSTTTESLQNAENQGDFLLGKILQKHYHIRERVAKGGMAWIYRAEHKTLQNEMAIKILFPQLLEEPELRERFLEEARIQFALKHPNIVQVTDVISEQGLVGIVLEWINGHDLRYWLRNHRQPFTPFQIREVMLPVVDAIGFAHERGIIHRDLKPGNILFHKERKRIVPKVADFGIAKALNDVDSRTQTGTMMGTLQYMSPEQIRDSKYVDQRSDVYSLGIILFRIATARLPFREKNALVLMRHHEMTQPPTPSHIFPPITEQLDALILRCLEKDPDKRFQSCDELAEALEELPEASTYNKMSLFPPDLIGPLAPKNDIGDPHQSNPNRVKVYTNDALPTASIVPSAPLTKNIKPNHTTQNKLVQQRQFAEEGGFPAGPSQSPQPQATPPRPTAGRSTQHDSDLPSKMEAYIKEAEVEIKPEVQQKSQNTAARALRFVAPEPVSEPQAEPKRTSKRPLFLLLFFLFASTGAGVFWFGMDQKSTVIVDAGPVIASKPDKRYEPPIIDKLDSAVDDALRAIKMEKLALASKKLKYAMSLSPKKGKKPAWFKTKYYPELFRVAGRVAMGRNRLYSATQYFKRYSGADLADKSIREVTKHKRETDKLKKRILPQLKAELKKRVSKAEKLLAGIQKGIKQNKLNQAFGLYQNLRKTVTSEPNIYRKLAYSLRTFFPTLSMAIYQNILDNMLISKKMANKIRKEKEALLQILGKRQETIQSDFKQAKGLAQKKKYRKLLRWLQKSYRTNQSAPIFHQEMVKLLTHLVAQNSGQAKRVLRSYMRLFRKYTQKGFIKWASTSEKPLDLPTYDKLKDMRSMLRNWQRFAKILRRVRKLLQRKKINTAHRQFKRLPKGWKNWFQKDQWKFYKYVVPGASLTRGYRVLGHAFQTYRSSVRLYTTDRLNKSIDSHENLKQYLKEKKNSLDAFVGKLAISRWQRHLNGLKQESKQSQRFLSSAQKFSRKKMWKQCSDIYNLHIKKFPKSFRKKWLKRRLDDCNCNQNVPWVACSKRKKKAPSKK